MKNLETMASRLEALGNPTRLAIYQLLVRAGDDGKSVGTIQSALSIPASTLSHHLKHLELVGLIDKSKIGTTHTCTANYRTMDEILAFLTEECCVEAERDAANDHLAHRLKHGAQPN